jgi:cytochrome d ubiquinol oxidase subunit II
MPSLELLLGGVMLVSLTFYVLLAGADYGGGIWDLFASGPRAKAQRELIAKAIAPIWEANHVWLILVVVVLFTAFPQAYALISTSLHVALLLLLLGIVLRGSAFIFRAYDAAPGRAQGRVFAVASLGTPILLGVVVGAISSGSIHPPGEHETLAYFFTWAAPFPLAVGLFALVLFALLAAVYLTLETDDTALQDDFRRRAIACELLAALVALAVFLLSQTDAPAIRVRLANSWWTFPLQAATALAALGTLAALWARRFPWARLCAAE